MSLKEIIAIGILSLVLIATIVYLITQQKKKILEWLKYAVAEAEKALGSGTGQLKLRLVYDWFCDKFPIAAAVLPFGVFSAWVDTALETFRKWLDENKNVAEYIKEE